MNEYEAHLNSYTSRVLPLGRVQWSSNYQALAE